MNNPPLHASASPKGSSTPSPTDSPRGNLSNNSIQHSTDSNSHPHRFQFPSNSPRPQYPLNQRVGYPQHQAHSHYFIPRNQSYQPQHQNHPQSQPQQQPPGYRPPSSSSSGSDHSGYQRIPSSTPTPPNETIRGFSNGNTKKNSVSPHHVVRNPLKSSSTPPPQQGTPTRDQSGQFGRVPITQRPRRWDPADSNWRPSRSPSPMNQILHKRKPSYPTPPPPSYHQITTQRKISSREIDPYQSTSFGQAVAKRLNHLGNSHPMEYTEYQTLTPSSVQPLLELNSLPDLIQHLKSSSPNPRTTVLPINALLHCLQAADTQASKSRTSQQQIKTLQNNLENTIKKLTFLRVSVNQQQQALKQKELDLKNSQSRLKSASSEGKSRITSDPEDIKQERPSHQEVPSNDSSKFFEIPYEELTLFEQIGEGGFGIVYKGLWKGSPVAVKKVTKTVSESALKQFRDEIEILSNLRHPNIILFLGACTTPPNLCFVMEYLVGGSVTDVLACRKSGVPLERLIAIGQDICRGMIYLHSQNPKIIHRDLKSTNILLDTENGTAKIADFGLSRSMYGNENKLSKLEGSPFWMAPEFFHGSVGNSDVTYNEACDVYGFGIILWELLTGKFPFQSLKLNSIQVCIQVLQGVRPKIPPKTPPELASLISQCWRMQPEHRPRFPLILSKLENFSKVLINQQLESSFESLVEVDPLISF